MSTVLSELLELLGEDATLTFVQAYAGTRRKIPKTMPKEHELIDLLGPEHFARLWEYFGGSEMAVPMARRWRFEVYTRRGMMPKEIAVKCGCTEMNYYSWRRCASDSRQGVLSL
jgi:hypothetical protein